MNKSERNLVVVLSVFYCLSFHLVDEVSSSTFRYTNTNGVLKNPQLLDHLMKGRQFPQNEPSIVVGSTTSDSPNPQNSLLETFSLSFAGNFNFANAVDGIRKIVEGIASFIDMSFIRASVDVITDRMFPNTSDNGALDNLLYLTTSENKQNELDGQILEGGVSHQEQQLQLRADFDIGGGADGVMSEKKVFEMTKKREILKEEITSVIGAVLDKQECWERTACMIGQKTSRFAAKDVLFLLAERMVPDWKYTLDLVRDGSEDQDLCSKFVCSPKPNNNVSN